jgi:enoyl-CoA hydratase/carnithine racemase
MCVPEFEQLHYSVDDGVATVRLDRPEHLNAFTSQLYGEVKWAMWKATADDSVDVVVITGTGRAFATGGDLKETLARLESDDPLAMHAFFDNLPWHDVRDCPKVVIAAVNGLCLAGGLITALCADISVAAASARFGFAEGRVGAGNERGMDRHLLGFTLRLVHAIHVIAEQIHWRRAVDVRSGRLPRNRDRVLGEF